MQTEEAGYRVEEIPRSLVAPLKRGRRIPHELSNSHTVRLDVCFGTCEIRETTLGETRDRKLEIGYGIFGDMCYAVRVCVFA